MRGMIHRGTLPTPIIMVHGYFSSNRIGPNRLYFQIAQALNKIGYTVIRTDLSGMGESDGEIEDIHFSDHISDVQTIIRNAIQRDDLCRSTRFHLLGHCIGCCTAIKASQEFRENIESITLLSPFIPSQENHIKLLGAENYHRITQTGSGYRKGAYCSNSFIRAAYILTEPSTNDLLSSITANVIFSQEDEFNDLIDSIRWSKSIPLTSKVIDNASHNYLGPIVRTKLLEYLVTLFLKELV